MPQLAKKPKIERDRFTEDGVRLFNPSLPHGVVYCDGYIEVKYIQAFEGREVQYRGDHAPIGYTKGVPLPKHADELLEENVSLQNRIHELEAAQSRTNALLERLSAQMAAKDTPGAGQPSGPDEDEPPPPGPAEATYGAQAKPAPTPGGVGKVKK